MSKSSWRALLREIISHSPDRERLASQMGIRSITLMRWMNGESEPRAHNLHLLLQALPQPQRGEMAALLAREYDESFDEVADDFSDEVESAFMLQIFETRATTPDHLLLWTLCHKVFRQALHQLDPEHVGVFISLVSCMPPSERGKIRSLREHMGMGTPPYPRELGHEALFLGAESLAGYVVTHCRPQAIDDLRNTNNLLPIRREAYEISAAACPIMFTTRVAGCVLASSTQVGYFRSSARMALIQSYTHLLALAFTPQQFYPTVQIELQMMPAKEVQRAAFATFQRRVSRIMKESIQFAQPLTQMQAEQQAWQEIEEELLDPDAAERQKFNGVRKESQNGNL